MVCLNFTLTRLQAVNGLLELRIDEIAGVNGLLELHIDEIADGQRSA